jgi:hypothetical protein
MRGSLRIFRRLRYGRPIVVVSGLPRSGTSMMMQMLGAGGLPLATDAVRAADESNPEGYFELEQVKTLDRTLDHPWLRNCRGKAVKIISFLLPYLPDGHDYRVLFMRREESEVLVSQERMLGRRGESAGGNAAALGHQFREHLERVMRLLHEDPRFDVLEVSHRRVLDDPLAQATRVQRFLRTRLHVLAMAGAVNPALYRNRHADPGSPHRM